MLRRLHKEMVEDSQTPTAGKKSKRQRILQLFKWRKQKPQPHDVPAPLAVDKTSPPKPRHETKPTDKSTVEQSSKADGTTTAAPQAETREASPPVPESEKKEAERVTTLSKAQLHTLFAGAPHFGVAEVDGRLVPTATHPWDAESPQDGSDSVHLVEPAFLATTLHGQSLRLAHTPNKGANYQTYTLDVFERPSMLSAQGIEPGSIGLSHFLELPKADALAIDLEQSQSSKDFLEATRNKELMQSNPERIGIRPVEADLVSDRLVELQDLYEAFQESPGPMTILNNQSSGDLYANLFTKFLMPPGPDGSDDDPTGLYVQIAALLKTLRLRGVWYDFSLVEWRIRLGQILWSDSALEPEHEALPQWTERDILILQITLACELLLRLDAITMTTTDSKDQSLDASDEIRGFSRLKTKKIDWDLVLARTILENILFVKGSHEQSSSAQPHSRALLSLFSAGAEPDLPQTDIVLLPQHQSRQLSGLARFAEALHWPNIDLLSKELAQKLGIHESLEQAEQRPTSSSRFLETTTPSSISIYGTPLQTPRSPRDSYFGHLGKPALNRNDSRSLRLPLSPSSMSSRDQPIPVLSAIGGWLSRSCLTGLVLPGEALSHFLMSTLLENDRLAIASLGESANLYGGFTWMERTWWSKNSIVGRVLACVEGSAECMGWISCTKLPEDFRDQWHSIQSEQLPGQNRLRSKGTSALVALDSAVVPEGSSSSIRPEDFVLPSDSEAIFRPSSMSTQWELTPLNTDLMDTDTLSDTPVENDIHIASVSVNLPGQGAVHTISLLYDVQFVTSWPCTSPASALTSVTNIPHILTSSFTGTLSRSSSKRSETLSRRNSHGFEPLLSHPPTSTDIAPQRTYTPDPEEGPGTSHPKSVPMHTHPLHRSYLYRIVPVMEALNSSFVLPFASHAQGSATRSSSVSRKREAESSATLQYKQTVLVLDARASSDSELVARAWCAEKGLHAIISRVERTCLACSIREARGLGINIVIRV